MNLGAWGAGGVVVPSGSLSVRQLTDSEQTQVEALYQWSSVPPWGSVVSMPFGKVLIFDAADGRRRYTLLSGSGAASVADQINKAEYQSPDAGLMALIEDLLHRAEQAGKATLGLGAIVGVVALAVVLGKRG